ncbi:unnamed protein product [Lactuca saligna]|uniref:Mediator of RNA polymerase II transcription subunit 19a n=1 Tax=Lactuca saligna TaxID=75948 RepID=A0AA35ZTE8_LACSI|nr:unnamed protein product [Lactuca saligna]
MDPESKKFGKGPRELTGAVDLISYYKLLPHHEFFCKKPLPLSISDTHYLHNVVGDSEIRKGEGMQLDQLIQNNNNTSRETNTRIQPFDLDTLREAFQLRETSSPVDLPSSEKGTPTVAGKSRSESKEKEKKHKKHKDKDKDKEHKKHKHRHKDRSKDKEKKKDKSSHHEKKRKHDGDEDMNDIHRHKKSKHKSSSKMDEMGAIKLKLIQRSWGTN